MIAAFHQATAWTLPVLLLLGVPAGASAQVTATSFEQLQTLVKSGDTIEVTGANGRKVTGRLGELTVSSLELLVRQTAPDGRETFVPQASLSERDVRQIRLERGDSVWKGTLIGAAVVGGPWLLVCNPATDWCYYNDGANLFRGAALITTGIGAATGALIDAAIRQRTMVYYRAPTQALSRVWVSPILSKSATGIQMAVRF